MNKNSYSAGKKKLNDNKTGSNKFDLSALIEKTFPLPDRFRAKLPSDIAELSRLLTSARGERNNSYLNQPAMLSAYMRYFLPWNVYRLQRLFLLPCGLPEAPLAALASTGQYIISNLSPGDAVTDLGSGPLTLPIALWLTFPQLRGIALEFRCVDKSAAVLDAGYKLWKALITAFGMDYASLPWKIKPVHASIEEPIRGKVAKFVSALNVFNEIFYKNGAFFGNTHNAGLETSAKKAAALLEKNGSENGAIKSMILAAEPGNPQGGAFISALRSAFLEKGLRVVSPCPHAGSCPFPGASGAVLRKGVKVKWCHFAFDTEAEPEAPPALRKLSAEAGIPKERATISFLLAGSKPCNGNNNANPRNDPAENHQSESKKAVRVRIISDMFPLNNNWGRYACTKTGMALITGGRSRLEASAPGTILELPPPASEQRDGKTGALILPLSF